MSKFETKLEVEPGERVGDWVLLAPLVYQSDVAQRVFTVPQGFVTNFASVPKIPGVYELFGGVGDAAAALHDWLYTTHPVDRAEADSVLREALRVQGVAEWKADAMYDAVRCFGEGHWEN